MSSTVQSMREQLRLLEGEAAALSEVETPAMRMARRGLDQMRERVAMDVEVALRPSLDVRLEGLPVQGHEIRIDALSRLLHSLQESISSVAQALTGKATAYASLPAMLRDSTAFSLAAVYPGSFGATLRGPMDKQTREELDSGQDFLFPPEERRTVLDDAVDTVLEIISLAGDGSADDDPIIDAVLPLGTRAYKHLKALSTTIVEQEMAAEIDWRHVGTETRTVTLDRGTARRLEDVLTLNRMTEVPDVIYGRLGTASDIRNRVELQADDGQIVAAKVADDVVPLLAELFTRRVQANVTITTVRSAATGVERRSFVVTGLSTVDESIPPPAVAHEL